MNATDAHICPDPNCWHRRVTESGGVLTADPNGDVVGVPSPEKIRDWQERAIAWHQDLDGPEDHGERAAYLLAINGVPALLAALAEAQRERDETLEKARTMAAAAERFQHALVLVEDERDNALADLAMERADAERMRPVVEALRGWYAVAPTTSTADTALMAAWEEHCEMTGECYTCDRPRCPECKLCPLCAGDGHDEGCSRQGDEYDTPAAVDTYETQERTE